MMKMNTMIKYIVLFVSALVIEICSTYYIRVVSAGNTEGMIFFAMIGPYLGLPFVGYIVETKTWSQRIAYAFCMSLGYGAGTSIVIITGL
jgi:hypothetical protein